MAVWYSWITKTLFVEHSCQVKILVTRMFGIIVGNAHKLVIAFLFVSNHSTWSVEFSAALAREQALVTATPVLRAIRTILEIFAANLNIALGAVGMNPFVSNGEPRLNIPSLLERGLNMHFSPKIWHILLPCDNCDIKNGRKQVKKFSQPWLLLMLLLLFFRVCQVLGGTPVNSWWGCIVEVCRPVLQILTRFQTKKCNFSHPFSDLACRQKLCYHYLGRFPFVRTDLPDNSRSNKNFTFNQNYPSRPVRS